MLLIIYRIGIENKLLIIKIGNRMIMGFDMIRKHEIQILTNKKTINIKGSAVEIPV